MKKTQQIGLVGLLIAMSTINPPAEATTPNQISTESPPTIEDRLSKITATVRERENQLQETSFPLDEEKMIAGAWRNGDGRGWVNGTRRGWGDGRRGDWVNGVRGGWADGDGRGWVNSNSWRDGWRDGGSFWNYRD